MAELPKSRTILDVARDHKASQKPIGRPITALEGLRGTRNGTAPLAYEVVKAKCDHAVPLPLFADAKDKFRQQRRQQLADKVCPACAEENRVRDRKAQKAANRALKHGKGGEPWRHEARGHLSRLPDKAEFVLTYDDAQKLWTGCLSVPGQNPVRGTCSGVMRLLAVLDRGFRGVDLEPEPEAPPPDAK